MRNLDARSLDQSVQALLRQQAVEMRAAGQSRAEVAHSLGVHIKTITRWTGTHKKVGSALFSTGKRGRRLGQQRRLTPAQEKALLKILLECTPDQCGLPAALWTRQQFCALIDKQCGIQLPVRTCGEYLTRWGLAPANGWDFPPRAGAPDSEQAVEEHCAHLATQAKKSGSKVYYLRALAVPMGAGESASSGQSYVLCAGTHQGKVRWMAYREKVTAMVLIRLMEGLMRDSDAKVLLMAEQQDAFEGPILQNWLQLHARGFQLVIESEPPRKSATLLSHVSHVLMMACMLVTSFLDLDELLAPAALDWMA